MYNSGTKERVTRSNRDKGYIFCYLQPNKRGRSRRSIQVRDLNACESKKNIIDRMSLNQTGEVSTDNISNLDTRNDDAQTAAAQLEKSVERNARLHQEIEKEWEKLKKFREEVDKKMEAVEIEKLQLAHHREQIEIERQRVRESQPRDDNGDFVGGLVRHLQTINLDVKIPRFTDETNPIQFLNDLERYLKSKNVRSDQYGFVLENILEGGILIWYEVARPRILNFEDFKNEFRKEFYSVPIQIRFRNEWTSRRYSAKEGNMSTYFYKQVRSAQFLEPKLPDHQVHLSVVQQFPTYIQNALATVDFSNTGLVAQALSLLENTRERPREANNFGGQNSYQNKFPKVNKVVAMSSKWPVNRGQDRHFENNDRAGRNCACWDNGFVRNTDETDRNDRHSIQLPDVRLPPPNFQNRSNVYADLPHNGHLNSRTAR